MKKNTIELLVLFFLLGCQHDTPITCSQATLVKNEFLMTQDTVMAITAKNVSDSNKTDQKTLVKTSRKIAQTIYYKQAEEEIEGMLNGPTPSSFKRAVFLVENAFSNGSLDYQQFDEQISGVADRIKILAASKGSTQVALHWAIFSYLTQSVEQNNFTPCKYDLEGLFDDEPKSHRINYLLINKLGNCHSLPFLYQILADEVGAECFIARAPMHYYIKHKDDKANWWNLELTSASYSRTSFIVESFRISDEAIRSGFYMKPLTQKEKISLCIEDLWLDYMKKYNSFEDGYLAKLTQIGLKYYPISDIERFVGIEQSYYYSKKCKELGFPEHNTPPSKHPDLQQIADKIDESNKKLRSYGYVNISDKEYSEMVKKCLSNSK
jgi:hypothetical protein